MSAELQEDKNFKRKEVMYNESMNKASKFLQKHSRLHPEMEEKIKGTSWGASTMLKNRLKTLGICVDDIMSEVCARLLEWLVSQNKIERYFAEVYLSQYIKQPAKQQPAEKAVGKKILEFGCVKCNKYYYDGKFISKKPNSVLKSIDFWNKNGEIFVIHKQNKGLGGGQVSDSTEITNQLRQFVEHPKGNVVVIFTGDTSYPNLIDEYKEYPFITFANEDNYVEIIKNLYEEGALYEQYKKYETEVGSI